MNYYEEMLATIDDLIESGEYDEAKRMIMNELDIAYVPRDVEEKLRDYLYTVNANTGRNNSLSLDEVEKYLFMDDDHQLVAVSQLAEYNLRNNLNLCQRYLAGQCNDNARAYLILSLIDQQVDHNLICYKKDQEMHFNPSEMQVPKNTDVFKNCLKALTERFMKEPSMLRMAQDLLYKELLMALPDVFDANAADILTDKIENYIRESFR